MNNTEIRILTIEMGQINGTAFQQQIIAERIEEEEIIKKFVFVLAFGRE